ncbi:hypothetical protein H6M51_03025 [Rhizobium sp. AQ_MP]|uniref:DUF6671 family protein n=1 Tax=Rhizobium sp. AQ_MP TaxID=2761536 RepID=UPI00163AAAA3|nr:DUF6671 family protein [Rhizobium sp. AQ_MP]MBC2771816.1 hypothetical protein [Rhizobium sp. AQ_MP]
MRDNSTTSKVVLPKQLAMATMHGKEQALTPAFAALGLELVLPVGLDTDQFGTFSRDRPRAGTMLDAARAKAEAAMEATGLPAAIASEGSYGPHPTVPFLAAGREMLLFVDRVNGFEVVEMTIDEEPSFGHCEATSIEQLAGFLDRIGFPQHGVIVAPAGQLNTPVAKGIMDQAGLTLAISTAIERSPLQMAHVETDMRAFMNPRRMETIARLGVRLAARLSTPCPHCEHPGWGLARTERGLPCSLCGSPTSLPRQDVYACVSCDNEETRERSPGGSADPAYCPLCNP